VEVEVAAAEEVEEEVAVVAVVVVAAVDLFERHQHNNSWMNKCMRRGKFGSVPYPIFVQ